MLATDFLFRNSFLGGFTPEDGLLMSCKELLDNALDSLEMLRSSRVGAPSATTAWERGKQRPSSYSSSSSSFTEEGDGGEDEEGEEKGRDLRAEVCVEEEHSSLLKRIPESYQDLPRDTLHALRVSVRDSGTGVQVENLDLLGTIFGSSKNSFVKSSSDHVGGDSEKEKESTPAGKFGVGLKLVLLHATRWTDGAISVKLRVRPGEVLSFQLKYNAESESPLVCNCVHSRRPFEEWPWMSEFSVVVFSPHRQADPRVCSYIAHSSVWHPQVSLSFVDAASSCGVVSVDFPPPSCTERRGRGGEEEEEEERFPQWSVVENLLGFRFGDLRGGRGERERVRETEEEEEEGMGGNLSFSFSQNVCEEEEEGRGGARDFGLDRRDTETDRRRQRQERATRSLQRGQEREGCRSSVGILERRETRGDDVRVSFLLFETAVKVNESARTEIEVDEETSFSDDLMAGGFGGAAAGGGKSTGGAVGGSRRETQGSTQREREREMMAKAEDREEEDGVIELSRAANGMPLLYADALSCALFQSCRDFFRDLGGKFGVRLVSAEALESSDDRGSFEAVRGVQRQQRQGQGRSRGGQRRKRTRGEGDAMGEWMEEEEDEEEEERMAGEDEHEEEEGGFGGFGEDEEEDEEDEGPEGGVGVKEPGSLSLPLSVWEYGDDRGSFEAVRGVQRQQRQGQGRSRGGQRRKRTRGEGDAMGEWMEEEEDEEEEERMAGEDEHEEEEGGFGGFGEDEEEDEEDEGPEGGVGVKEPGSLSLPLSVWEYGGVTVRGEGMGSSWGPGKASFGCIEGGGEGGGLEEERESRGGGRTNFLKQLATPSLQRAVREGLRSLFEGARKKHPSEFETKTDFQYRHAADFLAPSIARSLSAIISRSRSGAFKGECLRMLGLLGGQHCRDRDRDTLSLSPSNPFMEEGDDEQDPTCTSLRHSPTASSWIGLGPQGPRGNAPYGMVQEGPGTPDSQRTIGAENDHADSEEALSLSLPPHGPPLAAAEEREVDADTIRERILQVVLSKLEKMRLNSSSSSSGTNTKGRRETDAQQTKGKTGGHAQTEQHMHPEAGQGRVGKKKKKNAKEKENEQTGEGMQMQRRPTDSAPQPKPTKRQKPSPSPPPSQAHTRIPPSQYPESRGMEEGGPRQPPMFSVPGSVATVESWAMGSDWGECGGYSDSQAEGVGEHDGALRSSFFAEERQREGGHLGGGGEWKEGGDEFGEGEGEGEDGSFLGSPFPFVQRQQQSQHGAERGRGRGRMLVSEWREEEKKEEDRRRGVYMRPTGSLDQNGEERKTGGGGKGQEEQRDSEGTVWRRLTREEEEFWAEDEEDDDF
uniref:Histidine kinase/HSP90-like ATPase domain-containing protein n=1 Tax=Chromera velia CCMP2878 TaxID=1169474 RepID=A0A0G4H314_9ALVE|eukprot:Cvel_24504.t1-p1 / transcript=Cvel_24504.t1 / gene=Cvel_24504 / organism=Chromera_velia_CCMP2878 / gene_product=hypothetical protein / transcript_product=hypothetical protein / location=Cvel_scaffold2658:7160-16778(-) / protein_length=1325 / sequence_SO=supercontig / SO=protein_coding / is_pseudo=false